MLAHLRIDSPARLNQPVPARTRIQEPGRLTGQKAFSSLDPQGLQPGMPGPGQKRFCVCGRPVWVCYLRGRHWTPVFHIPETGPDALVTACPNCGRSLDIDQLL